MNVVVEDDGADQNTLTEEHSLGILESLAVFWSLDHDAANRSHCTEAVGCVFQWDRFILKI